MIQLFFCPEFTGSQQPGAAMALPEIHLSLSRPWGSCPWGKCGRGGGRVSILVLGGVLASLELFPQGAKRTFSLWRPQGTVSRAGAVLLPPLPASELPRRVTVMVFCGARGAEGGSSWGFP